MPFCLPQSPFVLSFSASTVDCSRLAQGQQCSLSPQFMDSYTNLFMTSARWFKGKKYCRILTIKIKDCKVNGFFVLHCLFRLSKLLSCRIWCKWVGQKIVLLYNWFGTWNLITVCLSVHTNVERGFPRLARVLGCFFMVGAAWKVRNILASPSFL